MSLTRQEFLSQIWNKYPVAENPQKCGRFLQIIEEGILVTNQGEVKLSLSKAKFIEGPNVQGVLLSGDWVEIIKLDSSGHVELMRLLAPCLESPHVHPYELFRSWMNFNSEVRSFFLSQGFDELQTPTLVSCPGSEPTLNPFQTEFKMASKTQKLYLPTSPELHLKKCLARGWDRIFEIKLCFRNGEITEIHEPEFSMLEWYRAFEPLKSIESDIIGLIEKVVGKKITVHRKTMKELFKEYCALDISPSTTVENLTNCCKHWGINPASDSTYNDLFFYLYVERVEPHLAQWEYLVIEKYPPTQAALARIDAEGWAERFEFFINGVEIANAFHELNNPDTQLQRFSLDLEEKKRMGREAISLDPDFMLHLRSGMPPSSGIAVGLDRLFMATKGISNIQSFRLFPFRR